MKHTLDKLEDGYSRVMVYGSLRKGMHNNTLLDGSKFESTLVVGGCGMYCSKNAGYPYVIYTGDKSDKIIGEVYKVDAKALQRLDRLEGISPSNDDKGHYKRRLLGDTKIWMYFSCDDVRKHTYYSKVPMYKDLYKDDVISESYDFSDWTIYKTQFIDKHKQFTPVETTTTPQDTRLVSSVYNREQLIKYIGIKTFHLLYQLALNENDKSVNGVTFKQWISYFLDSSELLTCHSLDSFIKDANTTYNKKYMEIDVKRLNKLKVSLSSYINSLASKSEEDLILQLDSVSDPDINFIIRYVMLTKSTAPTNDDAKRRLIKKNLERLSLDAIEDKMKSSSKVWIQYKDIIDDVYSEKVAQARVMLILSVSKKYYDYIKYVTETHRYVEELKDDNSSINKFGQEITKFSLADLKKFDNDFFEEFSAHIKK